MLGGHTASQFLDNNVILRCIGRVVFPSYALLLADSFRHIHAKKERVRFHLYKLVVLAVISELCYDLLEFGRSYTYYLRSQSDIITLLLAYLGLIATEKWKHDRPWAVAAVYAVTAALNYFLRSNYRLVGVLMVYALYWYLNLVMRPTESAGKGGIVSFRTDAAGKPLYCYGKRFLMLLGLMVVYVPVYHLARFEFALGSTYKETFIKYLPWYLSHIPVAAVLALYNGKPGYRGKVLNTIYSLFYPGHLLLLALIRHFSY